MHSKPPIEMPPTSSLILGTAQIGLEYGINNTHGKPDRNEAIDWLKYAYQKGIRMLDTAQSYGDAIQIISAYQKSVSNKFEIISKFKYFKGIDIELLVYKTIFDLDVDHLFGFMFHSFDDVNDHPELLEKVCSMRSSGLIRHIGVSIYTNHQLEEIIGKSEIDLIQLPYNLLDNDFQRGYLINKAKNVGKLVHVRSVFLQGLFFKDFNSVNPGHKLYPLKEDICFLQDISRNENISMTGMALQYPFNNTNIDGVLFGVDSIHQLEQNIEEFNTPIRQHVFDMIDRIDVKSKQLLLPTNWK